MQDEGDLFQEITRGNAPLPHRLRPRAWADLVGQEHLSELLRDKPLQSLILYGPPGCGKTTMAQLLAQDAGVPFHSLSAVSAGVKDLRAVIDQGRERARLSKGVLLFVDEIHRWSKSQQDALLNAVEAGWVYLIGATTENPAFGVISPLLSRCQVYRLRPLDSDALGRIMDRALTNDVSLRGRDLHADARALLIEAAGGDARRMLRVLETLAAQVPAGSSVTVANASDALQEQLRNYDRSGENHYDFASALIKSLRGSDPDAALLYLAAMLEAGEDPLFLARRLIIFASEDIGNAAPQALQTALAVYQGVERIGMPEGRILLGQGVTFLASCPKSNASYAAMNAALAAVHGQTLRIPNHLRNAPTRIHTEEGAGRDYRYPHDYPGHFTDQEHRPPGFEDAQLYFPTEQGQEVRLRERLRGLRPDRKYD